MPTKQSPSEFDHLQTYYTSLFKCETKNNIFVEIFKKRDHFKSQCPWCKNFIEGKLKWNHRKNCHKLQLLWIIRSSVLNLNARLGIKECLDFKANSAIVYKLDESIKKAYSSLRLGADKSIDLILKIQLSHFEFLAPITIGGFGQIFLLKDRITNRNLVAKVISITEAIQKNCINSYYLERELLLRCKSMYIVSILYSFHSKYFIFQIMEYVDGGDLSAHLCIQGKFSEHTVRCILAQLLVALSELSDLSITHGDIKLENVLYSRTENIIKLSDFGLAFDGRESNGIYKSTTLGTPEYMPPEQINDRTKGSFTDIWAVGICAFEMLTGLPPFYDDFPENIFSMILNHQAIDWDGIVASDSIKSLIDDMLDPNPMTRITLLEMRNHEYFKGLSWSDLPKVFLSSENFTECRNKRFQNLKFYNIPTLESEIVSYDELNPKTLDIKDGTEVLKFFPIKNINKTNF